MNAIEILVGGDNSMCEDQSGIENIITAYYNDLFSTQGLANGHEFLPIIERTVSEAMIENLLMAVEEAEIWKALFSMHPDKSLAKDGITALFYQHF